MQMSSSIKELSAAMVSFQKEAEPITKNKTVKTGSFSYSYAELGKIIEETKDLRTKNKIAYMQFPSGHNGLNTIIMHESGEWVSESMEMPAAPTPQAQGSTITYMRRYALASALGLITEDDDDCNAAQGVYETHEQKSVTRGDYMPGDEPPIQEQSYHPITSEQKICQKCKQPHTGKYLKCLDCWKKDNPK